MITTDTLLFAACFAVQAFAVYYYIKGKPRKKKTTRTRYRNEGTANVNAGGNVHYTASNEVLYYAQAKDLQKTVDLLFEQLEFKRLMIERYHAQFERQQETIDGLMNEVNKLNYERLHFPVLTLKESA